MTEHLDRLAAFLAAARWADLPEAVRERARRVAADSFAAIAAGAQEPEVVALTGRIATTPGPASVLGTGLRTEPAKAAFLNGTAGTFLELDEGNQFSRGHPGIHAVPAALAVAEARRLPGEEFLLAVVLGYEVGARIGIAMSLRPTMHPHGTWGTVGSAVAVAKLAGCDAARMRETINVSSTLGLATSRQTMLQGGTVRNAFAGVSGHMGVLAHDLVESGFVGERDGLATVFGSVVSERWAPEELTRGLGERWEIARNYFKRHACCRYNHGALDALDRIVAAHGNPLNPDEIARVEVETYALAVQLADPAPRNTLGAKFSVPFAVATTIVNRSSGVESFTLGAVGDARVRALAARVDVREDPALTAEMPEFRPARVRVHLRDGRVLEGAARTNRGDSEDPYSEAELTAKYHELAARAWDRATAEAVLADAMRLERLGDLNDLTRRLDGARRVAAA